jgi:hypothetical protein
MSGFEMKLNHFGLPRLQTSGNRVGFIRTDVSEECIASIISFTFIMEAIFSFETSVLRRATRRHLPQDGILQTAVQTSILTTLELVV